MASHSQVAHRWAQDNGRPVKGLNMFFERRDSDVMGPVQTLYSYGRHFPLASFVTAPDGRRVVLANLEESRSVSTSKHQRYVRDALNGLGVEVFDVTDTNPIASRYTGLGFHTRNVRELLDRARALSVRASKRRVQAYREFDLLQSEAWLTMAARYADVWGLPALTGDLQSALERLDAMTAAEREAYRIARAEREAMNAAREAALRIEQAPDFLAWQRGERLRAPSCWTIDDATGSVYVRRYGEELQTSRGASVPWEHAVKAFRLIRAVRARGEVWSSPPAAPVRVGHFRVDRIDANGDMRAGCHYFAWAEMSALADREGV